MSPIELLIQLIVLLVNPAARPRRALCGPLRKPEEKLCWKAKKGGKRSAGPAHVVGPLEQIQMLSPIDRVVGGDRHSRSELMVGRPCRDRYDDHRQRENHREPECKAIWFPCHLSPSWQRPAMRLVLEGGIRIDV